MTQPEDLIAKLILQCALEDGGHIVTELEVPMLDSQSADLCYTPGPGPRNPAPSFAVVNRMTSVPCIAEPFSRTPTMEKLRRGCLRKQLQLHHNECVDAENRHAKAKKAHRGPPGQLPPLVLPPPRFMWIISPGRPETALTAFGCRPMAGFPAGFHALPPGFATAIIVLSELPKTLETVILRLLGPAEMRQQALSQIRALPPGDADLPALISTISRAQFMIEKEAKLSRKTKEGFMTSVAAEFEKFKQSLIDQGRAQGRDQGLDQGVGKGLAQAILTVLSARKLRVTAKLKKRIQTCTDPALLQRWLTRAVTAATAAEVIADS